MKGNIKYERFIIRFFKSIKIAGKTVKGMIKKAENEVSIGKKKHKRGKVEGLCLKFLSGEIKKCELAKK